MSSEREGQPMSLGDEIDRSFGTGPEPEPAGLLLRRGQQALRRRRLVTGTAALAAVVTFGGAAAFMTGGDGRASVEPAGSPTPSTTASSPSQMPSPSLHKPTHAEAQRAMGIDPVVAYNGQGHLVINPKATVVQRLDNPFGVKPPEASDAVDVVYRGADYWFALHLDRLRGSNAASIWAGDYPRHSFASWVAAQKGLAQSQTNAGPDVWPGRTDVDVVRFAGSGETLEPTHGSTILEQRPHVSVGSSFAGPGDQTAAATVRDSSRAVYYVLARRFDGKPGQYIAVSQADGGSTLDAFLDLARQRYAEGGGGLL